MKSFTIADWADRRGYSLRHAYKMIELGTGPAVIRCGGTVRISDEADAAWAAAAEAAYKASVAGKAALMAEKARRSTYAAVRRAEEAAADAKAKHRAGRQAA